MTKDKWQPPKDVKPWIVCAAMRHRKYQEKIVCSARHWDKIVRNYFDAGEKVRPLEWEQGFIDQWGRFHSREEAYKIVQDNGQPFNADRNGSDIILYSEGLY